MNTESDRKPFLLRLQRTLARARFFTFSAMMHVILVVFAGGAVMFQQISAPPDFEAGEGGIIAIDAASAAPPESSQAAPELSQPQPTAPQIAAPSLSAITTASASSAFTLNSAPTASLDGRLLGMTDASKALGDKLAGLTAGGGRAGGMKGMRSAMIFGRKVMAAKLGVILDVSGSAHPHLAGAIAEIQKGFDDATLILYPGCGLTDFDGKSDHDIRKFSAITKRDLEKPKGQFTTPTQLGKALKIEEFEKMTKRQAVRDSLFVSWFNEESDDHVKLIGQTQAAFDELVKRGVDSIYWFADFVDKVDAEAVQKLSAALEKKKITLHLHNFAGKTINPLLTELAETTGGTVNAEKPKS